VGEEVLDDDNANGDDGGDDEDNCMRSLLPRQPDSLI
jgi:hypothetical protein